MDVVVIVVEHILKFPPVGIKHSHVISHFDVPRNNPTTSTGPNRKF